jgi:hypothetical protein
MPFKAIILFTLIYAFGCRNDSIGYKEVEINPGTHRSDSTGQWYKVISSFASNRKCSGDDKFAWSHLCFREQTKDTVLVITPCENYGLKKGKFAKLYPLDSSNSYNKIKITLPKEKDLSNYLKVYGVLKIPYE